MAAYGMPLRGLFLVILFSSFLHVCFAVDDSSGCTTSCRPISNVTDEDAGAFEASNITDSLTTAAEDHEMVKRQAASAGAPMQHRIQWNSPRLPQFAWPMHYDLTLDPNFQTQQAQGKVHITLAIVSTTRFLVFHAKDIHISSLRLTRRQRVATAAGDADDEGQQVLATERNLVQLPHLDQFIVTSSRALHLGDTVFLNVQFVSRVNPFHRGLFLSRYIKGADLIPVISSQSEPMSARRIFPCWDEPLFKAVFKISVIHPENSHRALSNMPVLRTTPASKIGDKSFERSEFAETPPMSPHLAAVVVYDKNDYTRLQSVAGNHVTRIDVHVRTPLKSKALWAMSVAIRAIPLLEAFTGLPFPLPKIEFMNVPDNHPISMQNWGLKLYKKLDLYADGRSSERQKQVVLQNVVHQLAHEWLGNLVTPKSWEQVWVKEGPGTCMEMFIGDSVQPSWGILDQSYIQETLPALRYDALASSHPLTLQPDEVNTEEDLEQVFDEITYGKGSTMMKTIAFLIVGLPAVPASEAAFVRAFRLRSYDADDLFGILGQFSPLGPQRLQEIMRSWARIQGFPLVHLSLIKGQLVARQLRYSSLPPHCTTARIQAAAMQSSLNDVEEDDDDDSTSGNSPLDARQMSCSSVWPIRLGCTVGTLDGRSLRVDFWIFSADPVRINLPPNLSYVKCNDRGISFVRMSYSKTFWRMLSRAAAANPMQFHRSDRASMISDAFAMTWYQKKPAKVSNVLELLSSVMKHETEYIVWHTACDELFHSFTALAKNHPNIAMKWEDFVRRLTRPILSRLGWRSDGSHEDKMLREIMLRGAIVLNEPNALEQATRLFQMWASLQRPSSDDDADQPSTNSSSTLEPNVRMPAIAGAIRVLGQPALDFAWQTNLKTIHPSVRADLLVAIAISANAAQLGWLFQQTLNPAVIASEEVPLVLSTAIELNRFSGEVARRHLEQTWDHLHGTLAAKDFGSIVRTFVGSLRTPQEIDGMERHFASMPPARYAKVNRYLRQGFEMARLKLWWAHTHAAEIEAWLDANREVSQPSNDDDEIR